MGGQVVEKEQPYATNKINVIGNIVPGKITINEEKGYAKYLVMIGNKAKEGEEERKPEFYNFIHNIKGKDDATLTILKQIKEQDVGKQVKVSGSISYSKHTNEQTGEVKYYNNFNAYKLEPTPSFLMPKASIELTGTVDKALKTKDTGEINPESGETKKFAYFSVKTLEGNEGQITKFHNIGTSNFTKSHNLEFLSSLKAGEQVSIKARLMGSGNIQIAKDSQVCKGLNYENVMRAKATSKEVGRDR